MTQKNHDLIELAGELRHQTDKAYLFYDGAKEVWIAKSLGRMGRQRKNHATARMAGRGERVDMKIWPHPPSENHPDGGFSAEEILSIGFVLMLSVRIVAWNNH